MRMDGRHLVRKLPMLASAVVTLAMLAHAAWAQWPQTAYRLPRGRQPSRVAPASAATPAAPEQADATASELAAPAGDPAAPDADDLSPLDAEDLAVPLLPTTDSVILDAQDGLISLVARDAALQDVLTALAELQGLNIVTQSNMTSTVNTSLHRVPFEDALDVILGTNGYTWVRNKNILQVTSITAATNLSPDVQGQQVEVFRLNYVSAMDVDSVVTSMLSPAGNSFVVETSPTDNRKTQEMLVVRDLPRYLDAIRKYVRQHDVRPKQVLIEAYILKVDLTKDRKSGVNFEHLFDLHKNLFQLETRGFANPSASQGFLVNLSGGNLTALIECLETTADAKTLASPKIRVLNGQQARIQVGEQLGFRVTTTTETSTTETVQFLNVGVVLEVTPRIGDDGTVIMQVRPEVSSGEVNPDTGLPEEATTELETQVMFRNNQAFVIGGLIQEQDSNSQAKLPWLGDIKHFGRLFQNRDLVKQRSEIIMALLPRVMPFDPETQQSLQVETERARTPLLYGPLERYPRPWEPQLPDAVYNPVMSPLPPLSAIRGGSFLASPKADSDSRLLNEAERPAYDAAESSRHDLSPPRVHTVQAPRPLSTRTIRLTRLPPVRHRSYSGEDSGVTVPSTMLR